MSSELARQDPQLYTALQQETARQEYNLELIASENVVSEAVLEARGSEAQDEPDPWRAAEAWVQGQLLGQILPGGPLRRARVRSAPRLRGGRDSGAAPPAQDGRGRSQCLATAGRCRTISSYCRR